MVASDALLRGAAQPVLDLPTTRRNGGDHPDFLRSLVPAEALARAADDEQRSFPALAKNLPLLDSIEQIVRALPSDHRIETGDSRHMEHIEDASVHLAITSPPYWTLKKYPATEGQLGHVADYEEFLVLLDEVWQEVYRVLVPRGRLVVVVGDVLLSRRQNDGRHVVFPLHASIQEHCRAIGYDNLAPIIWNKIGKIKREAKRATGFLGKPYEPNAVIKNDIEFVLFERKHGQYRKVDIERRILSVIPQKRHGEWFQQVWKLPGASTTKGHPAPFPLEVAERLVRMYSFVGDTVLDPFTGTGTTNLAAGRWGRNSIGIDIEPSYVEMATNRLRTAGLHVVDTAPEQ